MGGWRKAVSQTVSPWMREKKRKVCEERLLSLLLIEKGSEIEASVTT